jgi:hypothetical protein
VTVTEKEIEALFDRWWEALRDREDSTYLHLIKNATPAVIACWAFKAGARAATTKPQREVEGSD